MATRVGQVIKELIHISNIKTSICNIMISQSDENMLFLFKKKKEAAIYLDKLSFN